MTKHRIDIYYDDRTCMEAPRTGVNYEAPKRMFESPLVVVFVHRAICTRIDYSRLGYAVQIAVTNAGLPITGLRDVDKKPRKARAKKHVRESKGHMEKLL